MVDGLHEQRRESPRAGGDEQNKRQRTGEQSAFPAARHAAPGANRLMASTKPTNAAQAISVTAISCESGGKTRTNPLPLMSCEKLDTQNGMRNSGKVVQRSGGGFPGSRTDRQSATPISALMPS